MKFAVADRPRLAKILVVLTALVAMSGCDSLVTGIFADDGGKISGQSIDATAIEPPCQSGASRCQGSDFMTCQGGSFAVSETCPLICDGTLGCITCEPGTGTCTGDTSSTCKDDGSGFQEVFCDPVQGMSCEPSSGLCVGACAPKELGRSYIGCEYFPTVTSNLVSNGFQFAVAIANTSSTEVTLTIEGGALAAPIQASVAPGSVSIQRLPWVESLKGANCVAPSGCEQMTVRGVLARGGAYHLRSTGPITVYQFAALDYQIGGNFSYSNDASLLLPSNVLDTEFVVAAWPTWRNLPSMTAITATRDNTNVTVLSKVTTVAAGAAPAFPAGTPTTVALNQGDVLELLSYTGDFTGSFVSSDAPIQVVAGHFCSNVPLNITACDHLEESMFPISALGDRYVVTAPMVPAIPAGKVRIVRIVATQANTTLAYDPPQTGVATTLASAGDFIQIPNTAASFVIKADHKILVAEYMEGQQAGGGLGDPAFTLAVPADQYRSEYLFHAPTNYSANYVNIVALTGETVTLDGTAVTGFTPAGGEFSVARVGLSGASGGNHTITGSKPFGITVYGYGTYTSYWYPGGLNLGLISID